jgi:AraC-like DNA-binding protein
MQQDAFADVFQSLRVNWAEYGWFAAGCPWAVSVRASNSIRFYAVLQGDCSLQLSSENRLALTTGDLVVLPHGAAHTLHDPSTTSSGDCEAVRDIADAAQPAMTLPRPEIVTDSQGARLVSGRLGFDHSHPMHWWSLLPSVVMATAQANSLPWLESTLDFIAVEAQARRPGSQTLIGRLSELLVLHVIRTHLTTLDGALNTSSNNWLAALTEPQVGAALALLHTDPARAWRVGCLARKVGMSRSAFAARFTRLVGQPPLHYLTRIRMQLAAELLRGSGVGTAQIAERVGYVSDTAFCKAFKRAFGQAPGAYRRVVAKAPLASAA